VKCFSLRISVLAGSKDGNTEECGTLSTGKCSRAKPVLSTPAPALLTLQLDLHICERINSADPAVVCFTIAWIDPSSKLGGYSGHSDGRQLTPSMAVSSCISAFSPRVPYVFKSWSGGVAVSCRWDLWILDPWPRFEPDNFRMADALPLLQNVNDFAANCAQNVLCPSPLLRPLQT